MLYCLNYLKGRVLLGCGGLYVFEFSYSAGCLVRILFQPLDNPEKGD